MGLRQLMAKVTCEPSPEMERPQGKSRITVRKKSGEALTKDVLVEIPITHEDTLVKFKRVCAFMSVPNAQRDRALAAWSNLRAVKDIAEPMAMLSRFGRPLSL
jgi:2-methylcitrate dehydratase PrpD